MLCRTYQIKARVGYFPSQNRPHQSKQPPIPTDNYKRSQGITQIDRQVIVCCAVDTIPIATHTTSNVFSGSILGDEKLFIKTSRGIIPRSSLKAISPDGSDVLATDTGSRIGIVFVENSLDSSKAEMHFIINGEDQGPCTKDIPYREGALHAVVDVYGTTKQVKIIQLYGGEYRPANYRTIVQPI